MATKEPTQKAKLALKAIPYTITTDVKDDYYISPKIQKSLSMDELAAEVAALSTRQEDPEDIARTGNALLRRIMWYLSSGYSISTELGNFRVTAKGILRQAELTDDVAFPARISARLLSMGVCAEFLLTCGRYAEAEVWEGKFREGLRAAGVFRRKLCAIRSRRWV